MTQLGYIIHHPLYLPIAPPCGILQALPHKISRKHVQESQGDPTHCRYATGGEITPYTQLIHQQYQNELARPIHLCVDTMLNAAQKMEVLEEPGYGEGMVVLGRRTMHDQIRGTEGRMMDGECRQKLGVLLEARCMRRH